VATDPSLLPLLAVLVPFGAAVLIVVSSRRPNLREAWTLLAAVVKIGLVIALLPAVRTGGQPAIELFTLAPGLSLELRADPAGMVFALLASALWLLASIYSIGYMRGLAEHAQTRYYASFAVCLSATIGLAFAANLLTFFVFYELLTVATYPLVVHKQTPEALAAGRRYLAYLLTGGAALLLALLLLHQQVGEVTFVPGGFVGDLLPPGMLVAVAALLAIGFGSKAAVMPLHAWLPAAMVAPTPVSALLHAVAVVKAGVFGFVRATGYVLGPEALATVRAADVLAVLAAVTIVVASVVALRQDNLKRRLAYSTIAHLSYIVLGLAVLSETGSTGSLLHIANHAALKITLFLCAGAVYVHARLDRVSQLDGIGRRMPVTMGAFALASLGLAGLPPLGGFYSKWFLVAGALDGDAVLAAAVMLGGGLLTAAYLFPIAYRAFFAVPSGAVAGEASPFMVAPLAVTALLALLLGMGDLLGMHKVASASAASVFGGVP
jgi:multicomponent Na+:H+ antiporter subunit D